MTTEPCGNKLHPQKNSNLKKEGQVMRHSRNAGLTGTASRGFLFLLAVLLCIPAVAFGSPKKLVNDSEYSDKDFRKCIIKDYSDMVDGDDIKWVWTDPAVKLDGYKIKEGKVENKSEMRSKSMVETVKNVFRDTFADMEGKG